MRRPRGLRGRDRGRVLVEVERLGHSLELAQQLRALGAPALDLVGDGLFALRALGIGHLAGGLARALAHGLVLGLLRDVLEPVEVVELLDGGEPDFFLRGVDRERAQHVAVVDARDRGEPQILRGVALGELGAARADRAARRTRACESPASAAFAATSTSACWSPSLTMPPSADDAAGSSSPHAVSCHSSAARSPA